MGAPFLFVALDGLVDQTLSTLNIAYGLSQVAGDFGFKINLDYVAKNGLVGVRQIWKSHLPGRKIFVDLKMWNGKRTMISVVKQMVDLGVDYVNVYALADDQIPEAVEAAKGSKTKVLGVTVLTHYTDKYCEKHFRRTLAETVRHLTQTAIDAGCHGVILPGTALEAVRHFMTLKLCPGIRPTWWEDDGRHEQEITPAEAREKGADLVVCGSPIMKATDPAVALQKVLAELGE